jgi:hypothetical protein
MPTGKKFARQSRPSVPRELEIVALVRHAALHGAGAWTWRRPPRSEGRRFGVS